MLDRLEIAEALREAARLLELKGENRFKVGAYERAADALDALELDLATLVAEDRLTEIEGVGESLSRVIAALQQTGTSSALEQLRAEIPHGLVELSRIEGLTPKRAHALHTGLGVDSIDALRAALAAGAVRTLKGFGAKTEAKLREALDRHDRSGHATLLLDARDAGERLLGYLRASPAAAAVELAGEARRWLETVSELVFVAATDDPAALTERFADYPAVARVEAETRSHAAVHLSGGLRASLLAVPPARLGAASIISTGPREHVVALEERARARGLTLVDIEGETEAAVYRALALPLVPPELRDDLARLEGASASSPIELVEESDIRGMVHCHTIYSDGKHTIEEMARAADALGIEYLTITDHSPSARYARGVELDRLKTQWDEIARVQEGVRVRLLRGTESDILVDGALDYPDAILEQLDIVIASVHSRFQMDEDQMTARLVRAMRHPLFKIWGHALGRLILRREPFACRVEEVLDAIAESPAAIEVNGDPHRLDLAPRWLREARRRGIKTVVSVDAHSTQALRYLPFGVHTARRGGLTRAEVLNTLPVDRFLRAVHPLGARPADSHVSV